MQLMTYLRKNARFRDGIKKQVDKIRMASSKVIYKMNVISSPSESTAQGILSYQMITNLHNHRSSCV